MLLVSPEVFHWRRPWSNPDRGTHRRFPGHSFAYEIWGTPQIKYPHRIQMSRLGQKIRALWCVEIRWWMPLSLETVHSIVILGKCRKRPVESSLCEPRHLWHPLILGGINFTPSIRSRLRLLHKLRGLVQCAVVCPIITNGVVLGVN